jgi:CBS domain containing-hemolysin-like protein
MIEKVFTLHQIPLRQIMTPMSQTASVPAHATALEVLQVSRETGYSRLPALDGSGAVVGVVSVYDVLFDSEPPTNKTAAQYLRRAYTFAAETPLDEGLQSLRARQQPLAVIVDKSNRPLGIVTIEDMLARLIGEIEG